MRSTETRKVVVNVCDDSIIDEASYGEALEGLQRLRQAAMMWTEGDDPWARLRPYIEYVTERRAYAEGPFESRLAVDLREPYSEVLSSFFAYVRELFQILCDLAPDDPARRRQLMQLIEMTSDQDRSQPRSQGGCYAGELRLQFGIEPLAWPEQFNQWVAAQELAPGVDDFAPYDGDRTRQGWFMWAREVAFKWAGKARGIRDPERILQAKLILARCFADDDVWDAVGETNRNALADLVITDWQASQPPAAST